MSSRDEKKAPSWRIPLAGFLLVILALVLNNARAQEASSVRPHTSVTDDEAVIESPGTPRAPSGHLAVAAAPAESSILRVKAHDGLLSVQAQAALWVDVLDEVSRATGTHFRLLSSPPGRVTIAFEDLPAAEALRRLLGPNTNYLLRFREADSRAAAPAFPSEVWVLGRGLAGAGQVAALEDLEQLFADNPQAARDAALGPAALEIRLRAIVHFGWQGDQEALTVLAQVAQDSDPTIRGAAVDALELLVNHPEMGPRTVEVLGRLLDQHPRVREVLTHVMQNDASAAMQQLAADALQVPLGATPDTVAAATVIQEEAPAFTQDPQAARDAALGAAEPEMRRQAIVHFGWQGDQEALTVLAQVAQDNDPAIRGNAVDALELLANHPEMGRSAVEVLGRLVDQHPRVREVLTHVMQSAAPTEVRQLAADALGVPLPVATDTAIILESDGEDTAR